MPVSSNITAPSSRLIIKVGSVNHSFPGRRLFAKVKRTKAEMYFLFLLGKVDIIPLTNAFLWIGLISKAQTFHLEILCLIVKFTSPLPNLIQLTD